MTDIHLAGEALDDVEPDRQHDVDHDQVEQILLIAVGDRQRQREQQRQRRRPSGSLGGTRQRRGPTRSAGRRRLVFVGLHGSLERCGHRPSPSLVPCGGIRSRRVRQCRGPSTSTSGTVARRRELDRHHAAGHHDHAAPERRPAAASLFREPGERVQRVAHHVAALAVADLATVDRQPCGQPAPGRAGANR